MDKEILINDNDEKKKLEKIRNTIKSYRDFPKKGVIFRDIFPLFHDYNIINDVITLIIKFINENIQKQFDIIVGLESRGFLFGPLIAQKLCKSFVPIRKSGKLPGEKFSIKYNLEYGSDCFEIQDNQQLFNNKNCLIIDDLLATGGSLLSSINLIENNFINSHVVGIIVLIELLELNGRKKFDETIPFYSLVKY